MKPDPQPFGVLDETIEDQLINLGFIAAASGDGQWILSAYRGSVRDKNSDQVETGDYSVRDDDPMLDKMIAKSHAVGIDAPFGWPVEFAKAVGAWSFTSWTIPLLRDQLRFRVTDRRVHETVGFWPLSVSTDRIALPAMRTSALLVRHGVTDGSGDKRFYEVYPAGSLSQWTRPITNKREKASWAACARRCRG